MFCAVGLCVSLDVTRSFLCNQFISSSNCPLNLFPDHPDILQLLTTWACVLVRRSWVESRNKFKSVQQPLENAMLTWNCERKHVGREISECLFPSRSRAWYWHLKKKGAAVLVHSYRFVLKVGEIFYCDAYGPCVLVVVKRLPNWKIIMSCHQQPLASCNWPAENRKRRSLFAVVLRILW